MSRNGGTRRQEAKMTLAIGFSALQGTAYLGLCIDCCASTRSMLVPSTEKNYRERDTPSRQCTYTGPRSTSDDAPLQLMPPWERQWITSGSPRMDQSAASQHLAGQLAKFRPPGFLQSASYYFIVCKAVPLPPPTAANAIP